MRDDTQVTSLHSPARFSLLLHVVCVCSLFTSGLDYVSCYIQPVQIASVAAQEEELGFESDHSIEHECPIEDEELESDNNHPNYGESDCDSKGP